MAGMVSTLWVGSLPDKEGLDPSGIKANGSLLGASHFLGVFPF